MGWMRWARSRLRAGLILTVALCAVAAAQGRMLQPVVLVLGDSLSAAYGMPREAGWVSLLAERLAHHHPPYRVVNASISGETTQGGASRLPALLATHRPAVVIIALGANDGLRGLPLAHIRANLTHLVRQCKQAGARVLLVGMRLPPNYGPAYAQGFAQLYASVAREERVALVPFLLDGIALEPRYFQADGLHPTAEAQPMLLRTVWARLSTLLAAPQPAAR